MFAEVSVILSTGGDRLGDSPWTKPPPGQRHLWKEHGTRQELTSYNPWEEHGTQSFNCLVGRFLTNLSFYSLETEFSA